MVKAGARGRTRMPMLRTKLILTLTVAALALAVVALPAGARMKSKQLASGICLTEGGGRFVDIPGFPGEKIDRRLLRDVEYLQHRFHIFVTDGYSNDPVHAANGEHPLGLALDIAPDKAHGGSWAEIDDLAAWAEPKQDQPIAPFRWVGYDGDAGHGRGHHLHLSWDHSPAKPGKPADSVYTMRCPRQGSKGDGGGGDGGGKPGGPSGGTGAGKPDKPGKPNKPNAPSGGTGAGAPGPSGSDGGVSPKLAPIAVETGGVDG